MRLKILLSVCAPVLLGLTGPASATYWVNFSAVADCEGYSVTGTATFPYPQYRSSADADYAITLSKDGVIVDSLSGVVTMTVDMPTMNLSGPWTGELCGDYVASGTFHLQTPDNDTRTFTQAFTCDCPPPPPDACHYTPGYWKNHPEAWQVGSVSLGGVSYSRDEAIAVLQLPVTGDVTIILAHHLIAAKLNVAAGASSSIDDAIARADAYLVAHPLLSKPKGDAKTAGVSIKNELAAYNQMGCPGADPSLKSAASVTESDLGSNEPENATWGAIKGMYR